MTSYRFVVEKNSVSITVGETAKFIGRNLRDVLISHY